VASAIGTILRELPSGLSGEVHAALHKIDIAPAKSSGFCAVQHKFCGRPAYRDFT
jgi:hypothetical protein